MSKLIDFYQYNGVTDGGYSLESVQGWSNDKLEVCHDYIQWLFPTNERSVYNPTAPILTLSDCEIFCQSALLKSRLSNSFIVFLKFLGLEYVEGVVVQAKDFESRCVVFQVANHNWLRITRVILSLKLLGLLDEAKAFYAYLTFIHKQRGWASSNAFSYWEDAATCATG